MSKKETNFKDLAEALKTTVDNWPNKHNQEKFEAYKALLRDRKPRYGADKGKGQSTPPNPPGEPG